MQQHSDIPYLADDCGRRYGVDQPRWCGEDGAPVMLAPLPGLRRGDIDTDERSQWRYRRSFALPYAKPVSLGEGWTPLLQRDFLGRSIHFKLEWFNPTGSFKDRGTSLVASTLALQGVTRALTDSSGNGGSSLSAYCAAAGIALKVLVPASTSPSKVTQARAYGAEVELVPGPREAAQAAALGQSRHIFYAGHNWHPFFLDGIKTIGYELWEQLGYAAPDNIVVVAGAGSIPLGCDAAFSELMNAGQITVRPRLLLAQPANCCPIFNAFHGTASSPAATDTRTLAEGAAIPQPVRLNQVVEAVRRSRGTVVTVSEAEIAEATRTLAGIGLYCEPTSAVAAAGLTRLSGEGWIEPGASTVVILTGSGLKVGPSMDLIFTN